jgi:diketogulonate reductase-like aldo/keto reductase
VDSWRALVHLKSTGKARSIGVSNFGVTHLDEIAKVSDVVPAVNQVSGVSPAATDTVGHVRTHSPTRHTPIHGHTARAIVIVAAAQIEIHPFFLRPALSAVCQSRGIVVEAFCPLLRAKRMTDAKLVDVAARVGKSPAQVLLRWSIQKGEYTCLRCEAEVEVG